MKIILIVFAMFNFVYASVAQVSSYQGEANLIRSSKIIEIKIGTLIEEKDEIKTFKNSKVQLIFKDNTRITIGKNSSFSIEEYLFDENKPKASKAKFGFKKGLFRTITGKIGKLNRNKFKIIAKSATIGIRGTVFDVFITDNETKVSVVKGGISFSQNNTITNISENEFLIFDSVRKKVIIKKGNLEESREFVDLKNPFLDFGYWNAPIKNMDDKAVFIKGVLEPESVKNNSLNQTNSSINYSGTVRKNNIAGVNEGSANINIDLANETLNGQIKVTNDNWVANIGDSSVNTPSITNITSDASSDISNITGTITGGDEIIFELESSGIGDTSGKFGGK